MMKSTNLDKASIGLSFICLIHCLALPLLLVILPSTYALYLDNEILHFALLIAVVPISIYALFLGCKKHKNIYIVGAGIASIALMIAAITIGNNFGASGEKILTAIGASLLAAIHFTNFRLYQNINT